MFLLGESSNCLLNRYYPCSHSTWLSTVLILIYTVSVLSCFSLPISFLGERPLELVLYKKAYNAWVHNTQSDGAMLCHLQPPPLSLGREVLLLQPLLSPVLMMSLLWETAISFPLGRDVRVFSAALGWDGAFWLFHCHGIFFCWISVAYDWNRNAVKKTSALSVWLYLRL